MVFHQVSHRFCSNTTHKHSLNVLPLLYAWYYSKHLNHNFIVLIYPIQWTNAYPVGADRPAKRQKKTSCVSTGQAGPALCTRQVACRTSFLCRQRDVIASFSFGVCIVYTVFTVNCFWNIVTLSSGSVSEVI